VIRVVKPVMPRRAPARARVTDWPRPGNVRPACAR